MTDLLNLHGLTVDPARTLEEDGRLRIGVARRPKPDWYCDHCAKDALVPNGARTVSYADLPVRGMPVTLEWDRQRYRCKECGKTQPDRHPDLHADFLMTNRLYDWIGTRCLQFTFAAVANDIGLDERSVRRVFDYFDHRVTNAYTESINGLVKIANRAGRGYSFDVLRARMLLGRRASKYAGLPTSTAPSGGRDSPAGMHIPTLIDQFTHGDLGFVPTAFAG